MDEPPKRAEIIGNRRTAWLRLRAALLDRRDHQISSLVDAVEEAQQRASTLQLELEQVWLEHEALLRQLDPPPLAAVPPANAAPRPRVVGGTDT